MTDTTVRPQDPPAEPPTAGGAATTAAPATAPEPSQDGARPLDPGPLLERYAWRVLLALVVLTAVALRFSARSPLWLDEAQSVSIAKLPLTGHGPTMWTGLRQDGSPPLYYLLLHGWISLFGTAGGAVRTLSALLNLVAIPPLYVLGRRVVGRRAAWVAVLLYLTSPFALYFATETRMYSLLVLLAAVGGLMLEQTLRAPRWWSVLVLAACSGGLALTHYWSFYLLITIGAWALWLALRDPDTARRRNARLCLAGLVGGVVFFIPWFGGFRYQLKHTGTPWGEPASYAAIVHAYGEWAGGATDTGRALLVVLTALVAFGVAGRPVDGGHVVLTLRGLRPGRALFALSVLTLAIAVTVGQIAGNAWADRYTAAAFVPFLLVCGLGTTSLVNRRTFRAVVAVVAVLGLYCGANKVLVDRTQARQIGHVLAADAHAGDVLLICPDQLGPGLARELPAGIRAHVVPTYGPPGRVDWVDYQQRQQRADGAAIARRALAEAGDHQVFLAVSGNYKTYETLCLDVQTALQQARPRHSQLVQAKLPEQVFENYALERLLPTTPAR